METIETTGLPFGVKKITTRQIDATSAEVSVEFHWWFAPIAWFNRLRSQRVG